MTLSIALATYNGATYLEPQLESIYAQSVPDFEVIAADDASTDATADILERYSRTHGLRYVVNTRRLGFIKNFEKAISLCSGAYIALSDQDDVWLPHKLERLLKEIGDRSLICSDVKLMDAQGRILADSLDKRLHTPVPDDANQYYSEVFFNCVRSCTTLFKRELLSKAMPVPSGALSHDWWLGVCATQLNGFKYLDEPLVLYRSHPGNAVGIRKSWRLPDALRYTLSKERQAVFIKERTRIETYIQHRLYTGETQQKYLMEMYKHYDDIVTKRVHVDAFCIAYRHRRRIFNRVGFIPRWRYLLGRLV